MKNSQTQFAIKRQVLDQEAMRRIVRRMAVEILEKQPNLDDMILVGIRTRGLPLAERLADEIEATERRRPPIGALDITFYRDDVVTIGPQPVVKGSEIDTSIEDKVIILCDDVLYTGRTVRAALDELGDYGRPRVVRLAVMVDRGHRELPIHADVVGKTLPTARSELVAVGFEETDGADFVRLLERAPESDES